MQNPDIARLFDEVADLLEIQSQNPFRVRAYRNAARIVRDFPRPLQEEVRRGADLTDIPGIGEDLAEKIRAGLGAALHVERRLLLPEAEVHARALVDHLRAGGGLTNLEVAGSYR